MTSSEESEIRDTRETILIEFDVAAVFIPCLTCATFWLHP